MMSLLKKKNKKSDNDGFTLVEVLIAMMILTMAIVSSSNLLANLLRANRISLMKMEAYYLAQEGLESVRNIRDTNWLQNQGWLSNEKVFGDKFEIGQKYSVKVVDPASLPNCGSDDRCSSLKLDMLSTYAPFKVSVGEEDIELDDSHSFKRYIEFSEVDSSVCDPNCDDFVRVQSIVYWDNDISHKVVLSEILSDWKK